MKASFHFGFHFGVMRRRALCTLCLIPTLALAASAGRRSSGFGADVHRGTGVSIANAASGQPNPSFEVSRYFLNFDGDHSLNVATVVERVFSGYASYTVQLHLASGAEQSVVVAAPPGGLKIEMHDMTGDHVANDVVLRPAFIRWLPTVLVNDGHDHFAVALSGTDPGSLSCSEDFGSRNRDLQHFAILMVTGFKAVSLTNTAVLFDPQLAHDSLSSFTQTCANRLAHALSPGRAPPYITTI